MAWKHHIDDKRLFFFVDIFDGHFLGVKKPPGLRGGYIELRAAMRGAMQAHPR